jgi:hypothetical protein
MADLQLGEKLSDQQVAEMVAFLGALTDKERAKPAAAPGGERGVKKILKRKIFRKL